jgi:hypothetical protein
MILTKKVRIHCIFVFMILVYKVFIIIIYFVYICKWYTSVPKKPGHCLNSCNVKAIAMK